MLASWFIRSHDSVWKSSLIAYHHSVHLTSTWRTITCTASATLPLCGNYHMPKRPGYHRLCAFFCQVSGTADSTLPLQEHVKKAGEENDTIDLIPQVKAGLLCQDLCQLCNHCDHCQPRCRQSFALSGAWGRGLPFG